MTEFFSVLLDSFTVLFSSEPVLYIISIIALCIVLGAIFPRRH